MKNILVLTDFSKNAKAAEKYALQLAIKVKANLILYNSYPAAPLMPISENVVWAHDPHLSFELQSISNLQARVDALTDELSSMDVNIYRPHISHLGNGENLDNILNEVLIKNEIWLVVMGTKGERFANNILFGSSVFRVINKVTRPVLIVPENALFKNFKKVAYATDLASPDLFIFTWLDALTKSLQAEFSIVNVCEDIIELDEKKNLSMRLTENLYKAKLPNIKIEPYLGKNVQHTLHEITENLKVDVLALKHKKYGFFEGLFHSSTSFKMIKHTAMPILVFPEIV